MHCRCTLSNYRIKMAALGFNERPISVLVVLRIYRVEWEWRVVVDVSMC